MKHRWRTDLNWLCGVQPAAWARLLRENRIDATYAHRAAMISALALYNSMMAGVEQLRFGSDFSGVAVREPLFVLGHWRSGTTWLFNLLDQDPGRRAPSAFQAVNPRTFRSSEVLSFRLFGSLIPDKRVQDDVPMGFDTPEEDEYALGLLCGGTPYLGRSFPDRLEHYERFLTLQECSVGERRAFRGAMLEFTARLTAAFGLPLVLKSPAHTARVRWLLDWFPDARFVHIHRDPYAVFQSTRHLYDTVDWYWTLQNRPSDCDGVIARQYQKLHTAWFADCARIPGGRLVEVAYEDLVEDPLATLEQIYGGLSLPGFAAARPAMAAYLRGLGVYRVNPHPPLSSSERALVQGFAGPCFEAWGYAR